MEPELFFRIRIQWLEWVIAAVCLFPIFSHNFRKACETVLTKQSSLFSWSAILAFAVLGLASKLSQYYFLAVDAQDFWLFVDYLFNFSKQSEFVTRFGPQGFGPIQHGAVHPYHWAVTPLGYLSKFFPPVLFGLTWNSITLAGSGIALLALLKKLEVPRYQVPIFLVSYLFSTHIATIQEYDPHPETLYLLFSFLLVLFILERKPILSCIFAVFLGALKADALFVVLPITLWWTLKQKLSFKSGAIISFFGVLGYAAGTAFVGLYKKGILGPAFLQMGGASLPVLIPNGPFMGAKANWTDWKSILEISKYLIDLNGGISQVILNYFHFLTSSSFLDIIKNAPWVALSPMFWASILPLAFVFSLKGAQAVLWNYYSAPFLGVTWPIIAANKFSQRPRFIWILFFLSMIRGSGSMNILIPKETTRELIQCAETASKLIPNSGFGLVAGNLIRFAPFDRIISDRVLEFERPEVTFVLSPLKLSKWGLNKESQAKLLENIKSSKEWTIPFEDQFCFIGVKK